MATRQQKRKRARAVRLYYAMQRQRNLEKKTGTSVEPKAVKGCHSVTQNSLARFNVRKHTIRDTIEQMDLKDLRKMAQDRHIRIDGQRPSLCKKDDLIDALVDYCDRLEVPA